MKKSILMIVAVCLVSFSFAQSEKYANAMKQNIQKLDSARQNNNYAAIANDFMRIADAEKTQWLPYYYAAYATVEQAMNEKDNNNKDAIADKANDLIAKAETLLGKENSETVTIKSMIATAHMTVDPQSRFMTYGSDAAALMEKAEKLDPTNPRPVVLQAQTAYYTPETFGGGQDVAKPMFEKAVALYKSFKPESALSPVWGESSAQYFLSQYK
ncbi:MAG: hypothetical protein ABI204_00565 [Ginsengibacter sp.]